MCHRGRYTEHRHSMKDIDQCTRRPRPTLTAQSTPTLMRKNFRRGRLPLCHTTAVRIVHSTQLMVGRDTVTNTCYDKGRFREPSFVSIGRMRFHQSAGPIAAGAPISQIRRYGIFSIAVREAQGASSLKPYRTTIFGKQAAGAVAR